MSQQPASELAEHSGFVRSLARALLRDGEAAEDVAQETLLAAIVHRPTTDRPLRMWLASVVRSKAMLHRRGEARRKMRETVAANRKMSELEAVTQESIRARHSLEHAVVVGQAVTSLPDPYRTVLVMRYLEDLQPSEIAVRLDRSVHTVNTQLQRGIQRLRELLDQKNGGDRRAWALALIPVARDGAGNAWLLASSSGGRVSQTASWAIGGLMAAAAMTALVIVLRSGDSRDVSTAEERVETGTLAPIGGPLEQPPVAEPERATLASEVEEIRDPDLTFTILAEGKALAGARVALQEFVSNALPSVQIDTQCPFAVDEGSPIMPESADQVLLDTTWNDQAWRDFLPDADSGEELSAAAKVHRTDELGVARLDLNEERPSVVRVDAPGYATEFHAFPPATTGASRTLRLRRESAAIINRGAIPPEIPLDIRIWCPLDLVGRVVHLDRGVQAVRFGGLMPGVHKLSAVSAAWGTSNEWVERHLELDLAPAAEKRVDLSLGGCRDVIITLENPRPDAPAVFSTAYGPPDERGMPRWTQSINVHRDIIEFRSLPQDTVLATISSETSLLTQVRFKVTPDSEPMRLTAHIKENELAIRHPGVDDSMQWLLLERAERDVENQRHELTYRYWGEWLIHPRPVQDGDISRFIGIGEGEHLLCVTHGDRVVRRRLDITKPLTSIDLYEGPEVPELRRVKIVRGPGIHKLDPMQVELTPGVWRPVSPVDDHLWLPAGPINLRIELLYMSEVVRTVDASVEDEVHFTGVPPIRNVSLTCRSDKLPEMIGITLDRPLTFVERFRPMQVQVDQKGVARTLLRPGRYRAEDRQGRVAIFELGLDERSAELTFD